MNTRSNLIGVFLILISLVCLYKISLNSKGLGYTHDPKSLNFMIENNPIFSK